MTLVEAVHLDNHGENNSIMNTISYHTIDAIFGLYGSNNSFRYTAHPHNTSSPPHNFPLIMGSEEPAPFRRVNWSIHDTIIMLTMAIVIFMTRKILYEKVLNPMMRNNRFNVIAPLTRARFKENVWFFSYYLFATILGYSILSETSWFNNASFCVLEYPHGHTGYETPYFRYYMLMGCAFYVQALFTLLFVDEKLSDFLEMVVHHIATIMLISFCLTSSHHRVGSIVLILHDFVDIFLYGAKAFHHLKNETMSTVLFIAFTLAFFCMRLVLLPYIIYLAAANFHGWDDPSRYYIFRYVSDSIFPAEVSDYGCCILKYCASTYWLLIVLLCLLVLLHVFWFYLVLRILVRTIRGTTLADIREDDGEGHEHQD